MRKIVLIVVLILNFTVGKALDIKLIDGFYCNQSGERITGVFMETTAMGQVVAAYTLVNGIKHGLVTYYNNDGTKREIGYYKNNNKAGTWVQYNTQGNQIGKYNYRHNRKNGVCKIWDDNGVLRMKMKFNNDTKTGTWVSYDENKNLISKKKY